MPFSDGRGGRIVSVAKVKYGGGLSEFGPDMECSELLLMLREEDEFESAAMSRGLLPERPALLDSLTSSGGVMRLDESSFQGTTWSRVRRLRSQYAADARATRTSTVTPTTEPTMAAFMLE